MRASRRGTSFRPDARPLQRTAKAATPATDAAEPLLLIDASDLAMLMTMSPSERLGGIIRLNIQPRYHNGLDALAVLSALSDLGPWNRPAPDSAPGIPASSNPR